MTRSEILQTAKPIRFSTEMVRAIQDGRKTVARRRIKQSVVDRFMLSNDGRLLGSFDDKCYDIYPTVDDAPYQVDDILYVRETWGRYSICEGIMPTIYYKANGNAPDKIKWISSIHMPKEAARIFLRVTGVRVERLQDITDEQAIREGCNGIFCGNGANMGDGWEVTPIDEYKPLWNSTVKKSDLSKYGWDANPWVWVIVFERVEVE